MKKGKQFGIRVLLVVSVLLSGIGWTIFPASAADSAATPVQKTVLVKNMMCDGCVRWIAHALGSVDGVHVDQVTIGSAAVTLTKDVSDDAIKNAVQPVAGKGYSVTDIVTVPSDAGKFDGILGESSENGDPTAYTLKKSQTDYGVEVPGGSGYQFYSFDTNGQNIASSIVETAAKLNNRDKNISVKVRGNLAGGTLTVYSVLYTFHLTPPPVTVTQNRSSVVLKFADEAWKAALQTVQVGSRILDFKTKQYTLAEGAVTIPLSQFADSDNDILISSLGYENVETTFRKTYLSDTGAGVNVDFGKTYQFKITSLNGKKPSFAVVGGAFQVTQSRAAGSDYYFKVKATGFDGAVSNVYINGEKTPSTILTVTNQLKSDTGAKLAVKAGKTYQFKITASTKPEFISGTGTTFQASYAGRKGNDYFFKIKAVGKKGRSAGIYINGSRKPNTVASVA